MYGPVRSLRSFTARACQICSSSCQAYRQSRPIQALLCRPCSSLHTYQGRVSFCRLTKSPGSRTAHEHQVGFFLCLSQSHLNIPVAGNTVIFVAIRPSGPSVELTPLQEGLSDALAPYCKHLIELQTDAKTKKLHATAQNSNTIAKLRKLLVW